MASKRKAKKKSVSKKPAVKPPVPAETPPVKPDPMTARAIHGEGFWQYKAQLLADRSLSLRDEILRLRKEAVDHRGHLATLTKLVAEKEEQLAAKDQMIIDLETQGLEEERVVIQRDNANVLHKLRIDTKTHDVRLVGESLVLQPKPKQPPAAKK